MIGCYEKSVFSSGTHLGACCDLDLKYLSKTHDLKDSSLACGAVKSGRTLVGRT
jgi:hypothetical protein